MKKRILYISTIIIAIIVLYVLSRHIPESWTEELFKAAKNYGPLAIIGVIILEVIVAPIPGGVIPIIAGALYDPWQGFLYVWIGNMIGSTIAFVISQKYGKKIAHKIVKEETLQKYQKMVQKNSISIFLLYAIPIFPIDIISFALGLTNMKLKKFLAIISLGYVSYIFILVKLGDSLIEGSLYKKIAIFLVTIGILITGYLIQRRIENKKA